MIPKIICGVQLNSLIEVHMELPRDSLETELKTLGNYAFERTGNFLIADPKDR